MATNGIVVSVDELDAHIIKEMTKREVTHKLAEEYANTPEYQSLLDSIKTDLDEVKSMVLDRMVDQIIEKWRREDV